VRNYFKIIGLSLIILMCFSLMTSRSALAEDKTTGWHVVKMSGDAWVSSDGAQKVFLSKTHQLSKGDELRTGNNGRILLKRGEETILITPNSVMALPSKQPEAGKTQILQQAGELLLEVEKRNVKHFEVATPYLAAVVKGTRFKVTVNDKGAKVNVLRGKVEVTDLETGKFVLVQPGQFASVGQRQNGKSNGLKLGGKGQKNAIKQGTPKRPLVQPLKTIKTKGKNHALKSGVKKARPTKSITRKVRAKTKGRLRIGRALGHTKLNIAKATKGLSRNKGRVRGVNNNKSSWSKSKKVTASLSNGADKGMIKSNNGVGNGVGNNNGNGIGNSNGNNGANSGNGLALGLTIGNGNGNGIGVNGGLPPGLGGIPLGLAKKLGL
jgi:hypothetical protein